MQISLSVVLSFLLNATSPYRQAKVCFMPAGRKVAAPKNTGSSVRTQTDSRTNNLRNGHSNITSANSTSAGAIQQSKAFIYHHDCPMTPVFTALSFEVFYLFYGLLALFSQYVNIYKTNYHLIDYQEVLVIALFLMRRIGWIVFEQIVYIKEITSSRIVLIAMLKGLGLVGLLACFIWLILQLYRTTSVTNILLFLYPTMTYLWVFGFTMELKLQKVTPKVTHQISQPSKKSLSKDSGKSGDNIDNEACPKLSHCSLSPDVVRYEAEGHRADFNFKVKRALFQSFICAYYVGFIPMRFSKRFYVYYDLWWSCQHVLLVWIGSLILLMKYLAPLQYCDTLSKCAVHLGGWTECDEDDEIPDSPRDWSALTSWPQDVIVNYKNKGLYKSLGIQNVADPGDTHHWRFYSVENERWTGVCMIVSLPLPLALPCGTNENNICMRVEFVFQSSVRLTNWLLGTLGVLILYQLLMLCNSPLWHDVVSLSLPLLFNYIVLFKLLRDRWVAMALELKPT